MTNDLDLMLYKAANSVILPAAYTGASAGLLGLAMAGSKHSPFESPAERRARLRDAALVSGAIGATVGGSVQAISNNKVQKAKTETELSSAAKLLAAGENAAKWGFAYGAVPTLSNAFMRVLGYDIIGPNNTAVPSNFLRWVGQKGTLGPAPRGQLAELVSREESLGNVPKEYKEMLRKSYAEGKAGTDATNFIKHLQSGASRIQSKVDEIAGNPNSILDVINGRAKIQGLSDGELLNMREAIQRAYGIDGSRRISALNLRNIQAKIDPSGEIVRKELLKGLYKHEFGDRNTIRGIVGLDSKLRYGTKKNIYKSILKIDNMLQKGMGTSGKTFAGKLLKRMHANKNLIRQTKDLSVGPMRRAFAGLGKLSVPVGVGTFVSPWIWDFIKNKD